MAGASPTHKKSDSWAKRSAKLASIVQRSPRPRLNSPPPSPPSPDLPAAGNLICGFAYKRNLHFGYKKRFIAIDTGSGCFYYFSTHPSGPEASSQTPLSSLNRAQLESSPYLKVHCAAGEWTLSDCPDDDGGFFIFKGAATGNLQTKLGRLNSMFFKVIIDEKRQLVQTTHNPISSESSHADMEADLTSKEVWLKTAADLSARGSDTFLHSHISIKGLTQTEKTKRYRKTNLRSPDGKLIATQELEHKLKPRVHYPSTWMTDDEMMTEVIKPTEKLHDTTRRTPQSTLESSLGKVEVELLQCFGLPKLDRFGKTDAYAVMCVGSSHFRTETIDDNYSPIFLPKPDKRASQFEQIVKHPWFAGFDWEGIHERPGPLIPTGCEHMDEVRKRGAAISEGSRKGKDVCDVRNDREADSPTPAYTLTSTNSSFTPLTDARVPQTLSEE